MTKTTMFDLSVRRRVHEAPVMRVWPALLIVFLLFSPATALGQDGDGGTRSVFSLGAGSRAISMGGAFVSVADDASAIYWNPAALRQVPDKQFMGMYMPLYGGFADATYTFFGTAYPTLNAGAWGIGFLRVASEFEGFDAASVPTGMQDYSETQLIFGYAFEREYGFLLGSLATGLNFKIGNQKLAGLSSTSPGIDLGIGYKPDFARSLTMGVNIQDLVGPSYKLNIEADHVPRTIMAGLGYTHVLRNGSAFRVMLQLDLPQEASAGLRAGAEYAFARFVTLRVGLAESDLTFGLGVDVRGFGLDYAFLNRETAGSAQPVTFTAHYGKTLHEQRNILARQQAKRDQGLIQQTLDDRIRAHRDAAAKNEADGKFFIALDEWKIVLEYAPGDTEAEERVAALTQTIVENQEQATRDIEKQAVISTHFSQGLAFYQGSDYARARQEWRTILNIDSTHAEAHDYLNRTQQKIDEQLAKHLQLAKQFEQEQRLSEAVGEWSNIQLLDPGNRRAQKAIVRLRTKIQTQTVDLREKESILRIVSLYDKALQNFNQGKYQTARKGLEELLRLQPGHEEAKSLLAMTKRKMTPLSQEEEATIRRLYLSGMQFFSRDQYREAIAEWKKILAIDPTNESVKRNIEEAEERLKQLDQSKK